MSRNSKASKRSALSVAPSDPPRSPSPGVSLQGSSRTTGGVFRGKATGDVFNMADAGKWFVLRYMCS